MKDINTKQKKKETLRKDKDHAEGEGILVVDSQKLQEEKRRM